MLTFIDLERRLKGLIVDLDGELWPEILRQVNPPKQLGPKDTIHDLAFRDAKALAGYAPDLRAIIGRTPPKSLSAAEVESLILIRGLYHLMARLPVLILTVPEHGQNEKLIELYNGYRQILMELDNYLALAAKTEE